MILLRILINILDKVHTLHDTHAQNKGKLKKKKTKIKRKKEKNFADIKRRIACNNLYECCHKFLCKI